MNYQGLKPYALFLQIFIFLLISGCNNQNSNKNIDLDSNSLLTKKKHVAGVGPTSVSTVRNAIDATANNISRDIRITVNGIYLRDQYVNRETWVIPFDADIIPEDTNIINIQYIGVSPDRNGLTAFFVALLKDPRGDNQIVVLHFGLWDVDGDTYGWNHVIIPNSKILGFAGDGKKRFVVLRVNNLGVIVTSAYVISNNAVVLISSTLHPQIGQNTSPTINYDSKRQRFIITSVIAGPGRSRVRIITSADTINWTDDDDDEVALPVVPGFAAAMAAAILGGAPGGGGGGGGMSVPIPQLAFFIPLPDSGESQLVAICAFESKIIQNCNLANLPTEQYLVNIVSSDNLIMAVGTQGDILVSDRFGLSWKVTNRLSLTHNVRLITSLVYDEYTNIFTVWGYDNNNDVIRLSSENGYYWEDTFVPVFHSIFATNNSFCALESTGRARCWGSNEHNKLGLGDTESVTPIRALTPAKVGSSVSSILYTRLAGGDYHMCGLRTSNNFVDCWGAEALGDGIVHEFNYSTPVPTAIKTPSDVQLPILSLVGGGTHECLLDSDNQVWCWGDNQYGEIDATSLQQSFPSPVIANYNRLHTYSAIASGANFTCALENRNPNKFVNCWGKGFSSATNPLYRITSSASDFGNFSNISAGGNSACILSNSNNSGGTNLWCFGDNTYGQLGNGESGPFTLTPQAVKSAVPQSSGPGVKSLFFSKVVQSSLNTCGLDANTSYVYCWGDNSFNQIGIGITTESFIASPTSPVLINRSPGQFIDLSVGTGSICLIANESGNLNTYCLGDNGEGQIGSSTTLATIPELTIVNTVITTLTK